MDSTPPPPREPQQPVDDPTPPPPPREPQQPVDDPTPPLPTPPPPPRETADADPSNPVSARTDWPIGPIGPPPARYEPVIPDEPNPPRPSRWPLILTLLGGVLLGTGVTLAVMGFVGALDPEVSSAPVTTIVAAPTTTSPAVLEGEATSVTEVASSAIPSIVAVEVVVGDGGLGGGSGVVYGEDGYIITNHHVIEGSSEVFVVFSDGVGYAADVVGSDPLTDIAVLSTTRPDLAPIRLGAASDLVIGERAVAVGNPLGLEGGPSVTTGILSATGRTLLVESTQRLHGLLQTDAPITRGSSGGALLDLEAKLIGITTAIGVSDVGAEGLGFAVPVDLVVSVADDLIADGLVRHALLGIEGVTVNETRGDASVPLGVGVTNLSPESAYAAGGGEIDDVIVDLEGRPVSSIDDLITRLRLRRAGDEVAVSAIRGDEELSFEIVLGEWVDG